MSIKLPAKGFLCCEDSSENSRLWSTRDRHSQTNVKPRTSLGIHQAFCIAELAGRVNKRVIIY